MKSSRGGSEQRGHNVPYTQTDTHAHPLSLQNHESDLKVLVEDFRNTALPM